MTIINDYLKITREYSTIYGEKTLLLMQVGSFFESYALVEKDGTFSGSKIQEFADINDMTISRKKLIKTSHKTYSRIANRAKKML